MGRPLVSSQSDSNIDYTSDFSSHHKSPYRATKRSERPTRSSSRLAARRIDISRLTPTPSVSTDDSESVIMPGTSDHGSAPHYGSSSSNSSDSSASRMSSSSHSSANANAGSSTSNAQYSNCHFAHSDELQLMNNLVAMLSQNRAQGGSSSS